MALCGSKFINHPHSAPAAPTATDSAYAANAQPPPGPFEDEHQHDHGARFLHDPKRVGRLRFAFVLTLLTMIAEAVGGVISGSLALIADAGHMAVDSMALLFAFLGASYARRPADARRSYGYARLEVLVGYTNALLLLGLVSWIAFEAVQRLIAPQPILSTPMLVVACIGLVVNMVVLKVLGGHDHDDVNAAGAYLHVLGDLLGSVAAITAALLIWAFEWFWADAAVSLIVSALLLRASTRLLRRSAHILLEGVPEGVDLGSVPKTVETRVPAVRDVHHVHVWQLTGGSRVATLHAVLQPGHDPDSAIHDVRVVLHEDFAIDHVTVQLDGVVCAQTDCAPPTVASACGAGHGHEHAQSSEPGQARLNPSAHAAVRTPSANRQGSHDH